MARPPRTDDLPIPRPDPRSGRLSRQVVEAIESGIRSGQLRVGQRLPAERKLATQLGLSTCTSREGRYAPIDAAPKASQIKRSDAVSRSQARQPFKAYFFACQGPTPDNPRWLVLRIERCSAPLPFDRVIVDRGN